MINNIVLEEPMVIWIVVSFYNGEYKIIDAYNSREKAKARFAEVLEEIWHDDTIIAIDDNYRSFQDCVDDLDFRKYNDWLHVVRAEVG